MNLDELWDKFKEVYEDNGLEKGAYNAPGRVNLIGEHTDYNDGFVMPMAIDKKITMLAQLRSDKIVKAYSLDYDQLLEFNIDKLKYDEENIWINYIKGVISEIKKLSGDLQGLNLMFTGNVPQGAGLSSSAALEVVTALTVSDLNKVNIPKVEMALLAQRAENDFVGVQCGIMDQYISRLGKKEHALFIDCRSNDYELVPFKDDNYKIVICDSKVERGLVDSEYNQRREECSKAVEYLNSQLDDEIKALRDIDLKTLKKYQDGLDKIIYKRAHHVVSENERVLESSKALKAGELEKFGKLMYESHKSLKDDYQVSSKELDILVDAASQQEGVLGARMTGAGFGGCTVNLVNAEHVEEFSKNIRKIYEEKTGLKAEVYVSRPAEGASKI